MVLCKHKFCFSWVNIQELAYQVMTIKYIYVWLYKTLYVFQNGCTILNICEPSCSTLQVAVAIIRIFYFSLSNGCVVQSFKFYTTSWWLLIMVLSCISLVNIELSAFSYIYWNAVVFFPVVLFYPFLFLHCLLFFFIDLEEFSCFNIVQI